MTTVSGEALSIKAHAIEVSNSTFMHPRERALAGLQPVNSDSTLKFTNVVLEHPGAASFSSRFKNVIYSNITVSPCQCGIEK